MFLSRREDEHAIMQNPGHLAPREDTFKPVATFASYNHLEVIGAHLSRKYQHVTLLKDNLPEEE